MATKKLRSIKGRALRITRLDSCGYPVIGDCSTVVTKGFITVTFGREEEAGDEYTQKNADGEFCVNEKDPDLTKWWNTTISFCEVDPTVLEIITGANPAEFNGDVIGSWFTENAAVGQFAVEVWTKAVGVDACQPGGTPEFGFFIASRVRNGKIDGDINIGNEVLTMTVTGEAIAGGEAWGWGPYADVPSMMPVPVDAQLGLIKTIVAPPTPTDGCVALAPIVARDEIEPGDTYPAIAQITAESDAMGVLLTTYGFAPSSPTAWDEGEFWTIGTFKFYWDGTGWKAGEAPA